MNIKNTYEGINMEEKHKFKFSNEEVTVIEEALLRFCSYWNGVYYQQGIEYEDIIDKRTLIGNLLHNKFYIIATELLFGKLGKDVIYKTNKDTKFLEDKLAKL